MEGKDFFDLMVRRQSCRNFDCNHLISKEIVTSILEAAILSPSACNSQPYEIFAVQGEKAKIVAKARMALFNTFIDECNTFFIITEADYSLPARIGAVLKNVDFKAIDIGILTANLVNAACAYGIETCILGLFDEKKLQQLISRKNRIRLVIAAGYPKVGYEIRAKKRKAFEENVHIIE